MAKILAFSIVCFSFFAANAQVAVVPVVAEEAEKRTDFVAYFSQPIQLRNWEIHDDTVDAWKRWGLVENYSFGKNRGSIPMIVDLQSLHPYFRDKVLELIRVCEAKGI